MSDMKRREFITLLGGAAASWPLPVRAQQPAKVPRLGVLLYSTPQADPQMETVRRGLRELGYVEGQNLVISYHYAEGKPERLADLAAALVREKPDLVLALGGDVAPYAVKATPTIPIVFVSSADPVQLGLAASLGSARRKRDRRHVTAGRSRVEAPGTSQGGGAARQTGRVFMESGSSRQ
jgi:putative tryptophan/tyrosine transport system substrate-binding protein